MANPSLMVVEESIFLEEGFSAILEELHQKSRYRFAVDASVEQRIIEISAAKDEMSAYVLTSYIQLLKRLKFIEFIDLSGYLDFSMIDDDLQKRFTEIQLITNKRNVAEAFTKQMNGSVKSIFQFQTDRLVEWKFETKEYLKAFYLDKDHYHDPIDIEAINTVYSPKYGYLLLDASSKLRGGEGNVYHTYHNLMCKLFRGHHQNYFNHKKIIDMLSIEINNTFIIWPKDVVYFNNTFVGFVMDEVKGSVTLDDLRDTGFNGYRVLDRFKLALAFLKHVSYLHQKNIIIGDIKLPNVLVKSPEELFIIDTGSFQVFDYPCTVFTKEYTNKQYTSDSLKKQLRDVEDEYYAVNKVIFEIMMLKGPHYSPDSIEIDLDSLIRPFTYKLKPPRSANNLFAHEQIWFGLSERMREYFYYFFVKGTITYLEDWIQELSSYIRSAEASI
jgi:hypothetical protein